MAGVPGSSFTEKVFGSDKIIRVGVVGAGEVAQTTHLPTLGLLSHLFQVVALCDVSPKQLDHCASKFHIGKDDLYTESSELVKRDDVDLVLVIASDEYHASVAIQAADAGKHVFIEKPMTLTVDDAERVISAQKRNNIIIWVGYMRRYAKAFVEAVKIVRSMKKIEYARVRDIIGYNHLFVNQSGFFPVRFADLSAAAKEDFASRSEAAAEASLGPERASNRAAVSSWRLLCSLGSHDFSAMRELLGPPKRVLGAGGHDTWITALFDYGDFVATYETGHDSVGSFDAHLEVYGDGKRVRVEYDTPYVKGLPITLTVAESDQSGAYIERVIRPTYEDCYTLQYEALHSAIAGNGPVKCSPEDAVQELRTIGLVIDALYPKRMIAE
ncbi:NAD-P-binding protein [Coprinellus micaceus]|uniref:NAD-P-binding protein n=1 Tax=Coprinellus micaceus TaxID=71717 RepID=A0A4Y7SKP9_COPMI|nr:NAD-P-binding protein [Coprinellus micaceus]